MAKGTRVYKFAKNAKAARNSTKRQMGTRNTSMNDDYPSDKYSIVSVKRAKTKAYKDLEKTSGGKVFEIKLKKKRKKRK